MHYMCHQYETLANWPIAKQLVGETAGHRAKLSFIFVICILYIHVSRNGLSDNSFPARQNTAQKYAAILKTERTYKVYTVKFR